jgi:hypothetical protein
MYYIQIYIGSDVQLQPIRIKVGLHLKKDFDRRNVDIHKCTINSTQCDNWWQYLTWPFAPGELKGRIFIIFLPYPFDVV